MHRRKTGHGSIRWIVQTLRMAKSARALTDAALSVGRLARATCAVRVRLYVEYDVVRVGRICHPFYALELIEPEGTSDPPRNHVVRAGGITADTDATHLDPVAVKRKTAAEDVHAADALANHGIVRRAERGTAGGALVETDLAHAGNERRMIAISD